VDDIDWVDAAGNYVRLHVKGETHLFRETMNAMEQRLDPGRFARIHRSHMVNINRIKELQPHGGEHIVVLQNGVQLTLSRGYRDRLQERLPQPRAGCQAVADLLTPRHAPGGPCHDHTRRMSSRNSASSGPMSPSPW
jgi:hypothetical protein